MIAELLMTAAVGCSVQSGADFPGAYGDRANLVVGPFAWLGARRGDVDGAFKDVYRWKQPVLLKPGHVATLRIVPPARRFAGITYGPGAGWDFRRTTRSVTFRACAPGSAQSRTDGQPVTFWSGGIVLTRPRACVPVEIRVDRGRARKRVIAYGGARC